MSDVSTTPATAPSPYGQYGWLLPDYDLGALVQAFAWGTVDAPGQAIVSRAQSIVAGFENSLLPHAIKLRDDLGHEEFRSYVRNQYVTPAIDTFGAVTDLVRRLADEGLTVVANILGLSGQVFNYMGFVFDDWEMVRPTAAQVAALNDYTRKMSQFYEQTGSDVAALKKLHASWTATAQTLFKVVTRAYDVLGESYDAQITEMAAAIARLEQMLQSLLAENDRLRREITDLRAELERRKGLLAGLLGDLPKIGNPFEGLGPAIDKYVKYGLLGLGLFAGIKVLGIVGVGAKMLNRRSRRKRA